MYHHPAGILFGLTGLVWSLIPVISTVDYCGTLLNTIIYFSPLKLNSLKGLRACLIILLPLGDECRLFFFFFEMERGTTTSHRPALDLSLLFQYWSYSVY